MTSSTYSRLNEAKIWYVLKSPTGPVGRHLFGIGMRILTAAKAEVPKKTGRLAASINMSMEITPTGQKATIGSPLSYALVVHEGSAPHYIRGRNGGMLRFSQGTRVIYTRQVLHPGTRAHKYLSRQLYMVGSGGMHPGAINVTGRRI